MWGIYSDLFTPPVCNNRTQWGKFHHDSFCNRGNRPPSYLSVEAGTVNSITLQYRNQVYGLKSLTVFVLFNERIKWWKAIGGKVS